MSVEAIPDEVDIESLQHHLNQALEEAEHESTKYHIREACQKAVILNEEK
jgi:hypothetical protein